MIGSGFRVEMVANMYRGLQTMFETVHKLSNMAFKWKRQVRGLLFKYEEKLDDMFCDTYAVVLWRNPEPTHYTCIDIDHILNPDMLTNPDISGLVHVYVYEQKGYKDTEVIRTFYGRVLGIGSKFLHRLPYCYVY